MFADVILPLALPKRTYTYAVPESARTLVQVGVRVEVQFGKSKLYSGLVERIHENKPDHPVKAIVSVLDEVIVVSPQQLQLWDWISSYYCCTLGEVMSAALPGYLKLSSETKLTFNADFGEDFSALDNEEYLIAEGLLIQKEISVEDARKILNKKTVFPVIQRLLGKGVLFLREDLQEKYKPRKASAIKLAEQYLHEQDALRKLLEDLARKERQLELVMAYLTLKKQRPDVLKQELLQKADISEASLNTLIKKGVFIKYEREISRLNVYDSETTDADALSNQQSACLESIREKFETHQTVLLHGVTGSGKTRIYIELIKHALQQGKQVLYLLPEIGLTTQIIHRLQKVFGRDIAVYHSKINTNERVEVWKSAAEGKGIILGARSGLFLPFRNLSLIIVDEEHDSSFKQYDPAPRYHARDTAIYLAKLYGANVLLGTATPSLESWHNAQTGKYGLVQINARFGGLELPEISVIDLKEQLQKKQMNGLFSPLLLETLKVTLQQKAQAILFQNRRGYAPMLECSVCGWNAMCKHCDVSLTFHKFSNRLRCHYCGYTLETPNVCPACGSGKIGLKGFGTEKIEDELGLFHPEARIGRMDMDTAGTKSNLTALLNDFEEQRLDVLVGTQMVTKGLDFEHVALVGVLGADQLTKFPDFRSGERAFQLLTQVAGRAGRKNKRGKVLIQCYDTRHPVIQDVLNGDFEHFAQRELAERQTFKYPPFYRLIQIEIKHKDPNIVHEAAGIYGKLLRQKLGERVLGPVVPAIPRIRGYFCQQILLKLEKNMSLIQNAKQWILYNAQLLAGKAGMGQVVISIDVDPM